MTHSSLRRCGSGALLVAIVLMLAGDARAEVPLLLNYQGRLLDAAGSPYDGSFTVQFAIYGSEIAGSPLPAGTPWIETQTVTVTQGLFHVLLGGVTPLPPEIFNGPPTDTTGPLRYLQVSVNGEVLAPRHRIVSAAYAIEPRGPVLVDANGQKVGTVLGVSDEIVTAMGGIGGLPFLLTLYPNSVQAGWIDRVYFSSADCSGPPLIQTQVAGTALVNVPPGVPTLPMVAPGITAYIPDASTTLTATANSRYEDVYGPCLPESPPLNGSFHPATAVPLVDTPGARYTKPFRVLYQ